MKNYVICEEVTKSVPDGYRTTKQIAYVPAPEMANAQPFTEGDFRRGLKGFVEPQLMDEVIETFFGEKG